MFIRLPMNFTLETFEEINAQEYGLASYVHLYLIKEYGDWCSFNFLPNGNCQPAFLLDGIDGCRSERDMEIGYINNETKEFISIMSWSDDPKDIIQEDNGYKWTILEHGNYGRVIERDVYNDEDVEISINRGGLGYSK